MLTASTNSLTDMGAIDPILSNSRNHASNIKIKSASIEANNQPLALSLQYQYGFDNNQAMEYEQLENENNNNYHQNLKDNSKSLQSKAKQLLTLSPGTLKPSVSTSCLLTAEDTSGSNALVCIPTRASLTHEWKKLKTPNKCRECNLLVYFNGRECSFCGFVAHKKCVTILVIKCSGQQVAVFSANKNRKQQLSVASENQSSTNIGSAGSAQQQVRLKTKPVQVQPVFGKPINADSDQVVDFIRRFVYEIDTRGLTSRGIYRVSSIKSKVDKLCNYYDQNLSSLVDISSFHPNIIANALKMYLRQLPEPLLTHKLYNNFIELAKKYQNTNNNQKSSLLECSEEQPSKQINTTNNRQRRSFLLTAKDITINNNPAYDPMLIVELREITDLLPPINQKLVAIIMRHLRRVADMSSENQMSPLNLSIIFGPTLLNSDNKTLAIVDNIHQARVVELMITWAEQIFPQYDNYETKAVIELDLSKRLETNNEQFNNVSQKRGQQEDYNNDNKERIMHDPRIPQKTKTRQDLRESRRQFFTSPNITKTAQSSPEVKQVESSNKKTCSYNPPGSVPVIKVQPCYCNTLTKHVKEKRC